jgi:hypothetical protein
VVLLFIAAFFRCAHLLCPEDKQAWFGATKDKVYSMYGPLGVEDRLTNRNETVGYDLCNQCMARFTFDNKGVVSDLTFDAGNYNNRRPHDCYLKFKPRRVDTMFKR